MPVGGDTKRVPHLPAISFRIPSPVIAHRHLSDEWRLGDRLYVAEDEAISETGVPGLGDGSI